MDVSIFVFRAVTSQQQLQFTSEISTTMEMTSSSTVVTRQDIFFFSFAFLFTFRSNLVLRQVLHLCDHQQVLLEKNWKDLANIYFLLKLFQLIQRRNSNGYQLSVHRC